MPRPRGYRPFLETLEDRCVPSVTVNEFTSGITGVAPADITKGPDGNLWFTEANPANNGLTTMIGRITPQGQVTEFTTGITGFAPAGLTDRTRVV